MFEDYRNRMAIWGSYMGETMRMQSDTVVDAIWMNSVATRPVCVKVVDSGLPPEYTSVDEFDEVLWAHFEPNQKYNVTKDEVDFFLTFRPGDIQKHPEIKIGSYVSIPNVDNIPEWYLIMFIDNDNELRRAHILKTNWILKWVTDGKIYNSLVCLRQANSYNSGSWDGDRLTFVDNILGVFCPTNSDTLTIGYNQRMIVSDPDRRPPLVWTVSKIEDIIPPGITKFRFTQENFDPSHDNAELGLADYYSSEITPEYSDQLINVGTATITYTGAKPTIKVGGNFKIFTANFSKEGVTPRSWLVSDGITTFSESTGDYTIEYDNGKLKLKVAQNYYLVEKVLTIQVIGTDGSTTNLEVEVIG